MTCTHHFHIAVGERIYRLKIRRAERLRQYRRFTRDPLYCFYEFKTDLRLILCQNAIYPIQDKSQMSRIAQQIATPAMLS